MKKWIAAVLIAGLALFGTACSVEHTSTTNVEVEVTHGEENEAATPLEAAAYDIADDLEENWSGGYHVSYTEEENTVYVQCWDGNIDSETIADITNWDEMLDSFGAISDMCLACLAEEGVEDGHAMVQYVSGEEEDAESFLDIYDGEITYSYFE